LRTIPGENPFDAIRLETISRESFFDMNASSGAPAWAIENFLETRGGHLHVNGVDAVALVKRFGSPLYVFSAPRIRHNIERLKRAASAFSNRMMFCYASKANSNMGILRTIKDAGIDTEVNSGGELFKALKIGFRPEQIIFNGTSKTDEELNEAVRAGIYSINVDSIYEIELVEAAAQRVGRQARITLRLVPEIGTRSHKGLQTALSTSKFGISASQLIDAYRRSRQNPDLIKTVGLHIHVGSQTPDIEPFIENFRTIFEHLRHIYALTGERLESVNLGGGFPVNYLRDPALADQMPEHQREMLGADFEPTDALAAAIRTVREEAREMEAEHLLENLTIILEPGRSIIGDAGIVLTTVRNIKSRPEIGDTWLLTDAGFNLMLSMTSYHWYYHLINASRADSPADARFKVAGPLCDSADVYFDIEGTGKLPDYRLLPRETAPGDTLALLNSGAYSLAQMFPYNGRPLPAAVLIQENGAVDLIRRRDTYEDLLTNDVW
jgi:diaminopimelate decarboxylase